MKITQEQKDKQYKKWINKFGGRFPDEHFKWWIEQIETLEEECKACNLEKISLFPHKSLHICGKEKVEVTFSAEPKQEQEVPLNAIREWKNGKYEWVVPKQDQEKWEYKIAEGQLAFKQLACEGWRLAGVIQGTHVPDYIMERKICKEK